MENNIKEIPVDIIDAPADQQRIDIDEEKLDELRQSIRDHGLINPISVRRKIVHVAGCENFGKYLPTTDGCASLLRYELIAGSRRLRCHVLLGLQKIKCVVLEVDEKEGDILRAHENEFRHDPNPVESGIYIMRLKEKHAMELPEICKLLNKSESYVRGRIELMSFPEYILEHVATGKLSAAAAHHLAKIEPDAKRRQYVAWAVWRGITASQASAWVMHAALGGVVQSVEELPNAAAKSPEEKYVMTAECIVCHTKSDINEMGMYYAHPDCERAISKPHNEETAASAVVK